MQLTLNFNSWIDAKKQPPPPNKKVLYISEDKCIAAGIADLFMHETHYYKPVSHWQHLPELPPEIKKA